MSRIMQKLRDKKILDTLIFYCAPMMIAMLCICFAIAYINDACDSKGLHLKKPLVILLAVFAFFVIVSIVMVIIGIIKKKRPHSRGFLLGFTLSFCTYIFTEACTGAFPFKDDIIMLFAAPLFVYAFYLLGSIIFKKPKIYFIVITVIFHLYGLAQFYLYQFRGSPLRVSDLSSIKSATIAKDYSFFEPLAIALLCLTLFSLGMCITLTAFTKITPFRLKIRLCALPVFAAFVIVFGGFGMSMYRYGVENRVIRLNFSGGEDLSSFQVTGNALMFYLDMLNSGSSKPSGYSDEKALEILSRYETSDETPQRTPTVIAVMDESFADFSLLGDLDINKDYMPFYHSMSENTVKGYVTVSAYGGYSCNSEFEFLSGNSMGFFPMGSAAYTQYVKTPQDSLVNYFENYGYFTEAIAGCAPNLWDIGEAYGYLGFDKTMYSDAVSKRSEGNMKVVNGRLSDETMFGVLKEEYENKPEDKPMFAFLTTMQNHSPYYENKQKTCEITLDSFDSREAELYLSAAYETDKAIENLVEYFSQVDEDVVIVFFGDHFPHIPQFSEHLLGKTLGTMSIEDNARIHSTPFFIWANYDIDEQTDMHMSLNYLSNKLVEVCGMPKTDFQLYLDDVMKKLPSISSFGYKGDDGKWYRITDSSQYEKVLLEYNIVQYYRMFEKYDK